MKQLVALLFFLLFISCSNDVSKEYELDSERPITTRGSGQTLQINKSIVLAKLISKEVKDEINFKLKAKILSVEELSNYESIAIIGEEYLLKPNFYYDDNKKIPENERNNELKHLVELKAGDVFKAEISLDQSLGWILNRVLK